MKTYTILFFVLLMSGVLFLGSCKKESIEPSFADEPVLFIRGNLDGDSINYTAGLKSQFATPFIVDEQDTLRYFVFQMNEKNNPVKPLFKIIFFNYKIPFTDVRSDLDSTIKIGSYNYYGLLDLPPLPFFPFTVFVNYIDQNGSNYSSSGIYQMSSSFLITKIEEYISNDNKKYKKAFLNFNCQLVRDDNLDTLELKNGNAVIAFGYE